MSFAVQLSPTAEADLERLFDFLLDRAETTEELDRAQAAIDTIRATTQHQLAVTPYSFRKAAQNPAQRELIIPFGGTGYVALSCWQCVTSAKRTITDSERIEQAPQSRRSALIRRVRVNRTPRAPRGYCDLLIMAESCRRQSSSDGPQNAILLTLDGAASNSHNGCAPAVRRSTTNVG